MKQQNIWQVLDDEIRVFERLKQLNKFYRERKLKEFKNKYKIKGGDNNGRN